MKRVLILTFTLLFINAYGVEQVNASEMDSLLKQLDKTVEKYPIRDQVKEDKIKEIKKSIVKSNNPKEKFDYYGNLYEIYKNYQIDSAIITAVDRKKLAIQLDSPRDRGYANLNYAEMMMMVGLYDKALNIIQEQERQYVDEQMKPYIFHLYHSIYLVMHDTSINKEENSHYFRMMMQYKDSILSVLPKDQIGYYFVLSSSLLVHRQNEEALKWAKYAYDKSTQNGTGLSLSAAAMASVYEELGKKDLEKKFLIISAINDIKNGVREYTSLRKLAFILYEDGDIDRAYNYLKRSMQDAIFSNARFRTYEISQILPIINTAYDVKNQKEKHRLMVLLLIISILSVIIVGCFIFTYKQLLALARARRSLKEINLNLQDINRNLTETNEKLAESNHVKEEYIGYVFTMCSGYIDKMEDLRKRMNRKAKANQIEDLLKITGSTTFVADELKEFYHSFDSVFLKLYPSFIEDFNSLLLKDEKILPKSNDLLTPELRIFALVRLGINDSTRIAQFLHYSPQTVYNYRLKVRSKAKVSKDFFPQEVAQIGKISKT